MKCPTNIQLSRDCKEILCQSLLSTAPEEGCALLLGKNIMTKNLTEQTTCQIALIWPCSNVWEANTQRIIKPKKIRTRKNKTFSKKNHFLIDPKEQIAAQKWARARNLAVVGSAHSHPASSSEPSLTDIEWNFSPGLMIIVNGKGTIKAWWLDQAHQILPLQIPFKQKQECLRLIN